MIFIDIPNKTLMIKFKSLVLIYFRSMWTSRDNDRLNLRALQTLLLLKSSKHPTPVAQIQPLQSLLRVAIYELLLTLRHISHSFLAFESLWSRVLVNEESIVVSRLWYQLVHVVELLISFVYLLSQLELILLDLEFSE